MQKTLTVCSGPDGLHCADKRVQRSPLTRELLQTISKRNGNLSAEQVKNELLAGNAVYTNFSRYWIEPEELKPRVKNQGKVVVERCQECDDCQEWMVESTQAERGLPCTNLLVMFPDGTVRNCGRKKNAVRKIREWFKTHADAGAFNVGLIEWRQFTDRIDG